MAIAEAAGLVFNPLADQVITLVTPKGDLRGGVLYTNYTGMNGSIQIHVAGFVPRWGSQTLLKMAFDYPFNQLGVVKLFAPIAPNNERAANFAAKLGFVPDTILRDAYPNGDMLLMSMYRPECRFLTES